MADSAAAFTALKIAGAGYLMWLGIKGLRSGRDEGALADGAAAPGVSPWRALAEGFGVGVTNPKTMVFFVAVLPQFVDLEAGAVAVQMLVLGVVFLAIAVVSDSGWALAAGSAREWFVSSPARLVAVRRTGGAMLIGLGGALLLTRQRS
ncbi:LysE family translocator [Aeromicrobium duanguangcaii]|uniref:LysE family translocator n=1 Tax=Aeromicrobium duanguangcaii TaxID=2968086 RepID=A0ABY5KFL9_9ACTN|nr:LysE family translocator [Aeromicrobium duanguangcaii]MCD9154109.1 LysE family translocator [Aeromicrobium duanguangcaii]UUI68818.1 LysE family translocator [Aeromicrobium duanguangcaii]